MQSLAGLAGSCWNRHIPEPLQLQHPWAPSAAASCSAGGAVAHIRPGTYPRTRSKSRLDDRSQPETCWLYLSPVSCSKGVSPPSHPCRCFKVKPKSCAVPTAGRRQLVAELLPAGSFWRCINSTKAPFKPSIHYCCFQEHTQFAIWPGILYALSLMESNAALLVSGKLLLLSPGPGLSAAPLPPARCCWPCSPIHGKISSIWDIPRA